MSDQEASDVNEDVDVLEDDGYTVMGGVHVDNMTREQLDTRAIRMMLDHDSINRPDLPAVPESFNEIADMSDINIGDRDLRVVPECINLLTGLRYLSLCFCKLNRDDSFPDTLWQLTGLEKLFLSNNLTSIPSQIGQLSSLTGLNLSNNNLVSLPDEIYQLTNLTELSLYDNNLESISEDIGNLTNLKSLDLFENQLTSLPKLIGNLVNLEYGNGGIDISDNPLNSLPDSIRNIKHTLVAESKFEYAPLLALVDLKYQRWCDRKPLLLMNPIDKANSKSRGAKSRAAMYKVLIAHSDARYGDPARSSGLVQHIASYLGPRPNHVTDEAIAEYQEDL